MYSNRLQPALQNLLQCVVWFFHQRSSCTTMHISADVQRITLNASRMTISGERTEQLYIFCRVTGFTSDFLSFIDDELIRFFHETLQLHTYYYSHLTRLTNPTDLLSQWQYFTLQEHLQWRRTLHIHPSLVEKESQIITANNFKPQHRILHRNKYESSA